MATTFELIASYTVPAGGQASIDFTVIPSTYTDLCVKVSSRSTRAATDEFLKIGFNGLTTNLSHRSLNGNGTTANSGYDASYIYGRTDGSTATASTFGNAEFYIPNYTAAVAKSVSGDTVMEDNATFAVAYLLAGLWNSTAAITSVNLAPYFGNFQQYSTAYLYGVKNA
jgi:hypothetical protein